MDCLTLEAGAWLRSSVVVAAADRVYITDLDGTTLVISHEEVPRVIAVNRLNEGISASAAIVGREMFLRGEQSLYCLAQ